VEKEKLWNSEKEKLLGIINKQKNQIQQLQDDKQKTEEQVTRLSVQLEVEKAFLDLRTSELLYTNSKMEELQEAFADLYVSPRSPDTPILPTDLFESNLQAFVQEAAAHLNLEESEQKSIITNSFYLRRYLKEDPKTIVAVMLFKISQEEMTFEWKQVEQMWPSLDSFKVRQLYHVATTGFNTGEPTKALSRMRIRYECPTETS
jgi:predicted nuclease with TOPRIM domain